MSGCSNYHYLDETQNQKSALVKFETTLKTKYRLYLRENIDIKGV